MVQQMDLDSPGTLWAGWTLDVVAVHHRPRAIHLSLNSSTCDPSLLQGSRLLFQGKWTLVSASLSLVQKKIKQNILACIYFPVLLLKERSRSSGQSSLINPCSLFKQAQRQDSSKAMGHPPRKYHCHQSANTVWPFLKSMNGLDKGIVLTPISNQ